jgi:hypothetical protein
MMIYVFNEERKNSCGTWYGIIGMRHQRDIIYQNKTSLRERSMWVENDIMQHHITRRVEQKHESSVRVNDTLSLSELVSFPLYRFIPHK